MSTDAVERYPVKTDRHSSHSQILSLCGSGSGKKLLDVGCARGHLSSVLQDQGWQVTGIEFDSDDAEIARASGIEVVVGSADTVLENMTEMFDVIVFADVLEHFVDPDAVLELATQRLAPGGQILISIPNVAHLTVRIPLLLGSFTYADRGIMDRTHLHFYTRKTLRHMITQAGLKVVHLSSTPAPLEEVLPVLRRVKILRLLLEINALSAKFWKSLLAYQYIVVTQKN
jgi:2-polyprenyl-3-methyl-5-hydroxy-6-metoxy-1,4-benzoquinol methylase